jgi:hypothetical protein
MFFDKFRVFQLNLQNSVNSDAFGVPELGLRDNNFGPHEAEVIYVFILELFL